MNRYVAAIAFTTLLPLSSAPVMANEGMAAGDPVSTLVAKKIIAPDKQQRAQRIVSGLLKGEIPATVGAWRKNFYVDGHYVYLPTTYVNQKEETPGRQAKVSVFESGSGRLIASLADRPFRSVELGRLGLTGITNACGRVWVKYTNVDAGCKSVGYETKLDARTYLKLSFASCVEDAHPWVYDDATLQGAVLCLAE